MMESWYYKEFADKLNELKENPKETWFTISGRENITVSPGFRDKKVSVEPPHELFEFPHAGGTLVSFPEGIAIFYVGAGKVPVMKLGTEFRICIREYLKSKGLDAKIDGNDILVDGYKVSGAAMNSFSGEYYFWGIHISMNIDLDVIRKYCDKPMNKIPKGLFEYGITRDEILAVIDNFIANYHAE